MRSRYKVCHRIACQLYRQQHRYQEQWTKRTTWQSSRPSAVTKKVIHDSNRWYGQGSTPKCLHKQGIITAQISYITRKVEQTNGRENVMIHKYQVYIFPKGKRS